MPNFHKDYFVFTDSGKLPFRNNDNVNIIYQEPMTQPYITLYRYHMFNIIADRLAKYDFIFFFNSNCICNEYIYEDSFNMSKDIFVVQHPGQHDVSYINKYVVDYQRMQVLDAAYGFPEGWNIPYDCKILLRDKSKWFNVKNEKKKYRVLQSSSVSYLQE